MSKRAKSGRVYGPRADRKDHARKRRRMIDRALEAVIRENLPLLKRLAAS
jgi:hypothetical protein